MKATVTEAFFLPAVSVTVGVVLRTPHVVGFFPKAPMVR